MLSRISERLASPMTLVWTVIAESKAAADFAEAQMADIESYQKVTR